jgi:hypothetical protein
MGLIKLSIINKVSYFIVSSVVILGPAFIKVFKINCS